MKKLKLITFAVVASMLVSFAGCNDILDQVEPSTSVSAEMALSSDDGVRALRVSMYSKIRESFGYTTNYFVAPSAFADETRNRPGSSRYQALNEAVGTTGEDHMDNWIGSYNIIQDANLLIGAVEEGIMDQDELDRIQGEAYAIRAFVMHTLVRVYGYEPGMYNMGPEANWDEGVILRTEPTMSLDDADLRPRSSVDAIYEQIFSDLNQATTLLDGTEPDYRFANLAFAYGVEARAHLYAGNWSEASTAAQNAIDNFDGSLLDDEDAIAEMFFTIDNPSGESLFEIIVDPATEASTGGDTFTNNGPGGYTATQWVAQLPTQFLVDKYDEEDYRMGWYMHCTEATRGGPPPSDCEAVNDNGYSIAKFNGIKGNAVDNLPYMRLAEMYLIKAEADARAANNPAQGLDALQTLRNARNAGVVPPEALLSMDAFEDEILDERMRELAVEGHRFYDLKRLGRDVRHPDGAIKMRADSYRILASLGISLLNVNPELVENPGYN